MSFSYDGLSAYPNTLLFYFLKAVPGNVLYYSEHDLRHPLALYNVSMERCAHAFDGFYESYIDVIACNKNLASYYLEPQQQFLHAKEERSQIEEEMLRLINENRKRFSKENSRREQVLINNYIELLNSIMAYIDDTFHILKTLFPVMSINKPPVFANQWVKKADKNLFEQYNGKLQIYKEKLAPIVNKIKHQHGRIRLVKLDSQMGIIMGYFVEGMKGDAIGPDREIHQPFQGMETGISFNWDIRYHAANLYYISQILADVMGDYIKGKTGKTIVPQYCDGESKAMFRVLEVASLMPALFFVDEYSKETPEVKIEGEAYKISQSALAIQPPQGVMSGSIRVSYQGDGFTRSFKLPYFREGANRKHLASK